MEGGAEKPKEERSPFSGNESAGEIKSAVGGLDT